MTGAALEATVRVRRGEFVLDASVSVASGEVLALLGPNGSGKSTLLGALAGLLPLEAGTITVSSRVLSRSVGGLSGLASGIFRDPVDVAARNAAGIAARNRRGVANRLAADIAVTPEHRGVGLLGQEPLLFPHLSAEDNVAFGRRSRGVRNRDAVGEARDWLRSVGLPDHGRRKPAALSGGQQQRVAIARALAARPDVLLLDEPMAALDVQTAVLVRQLLRDQLAQSGTTTVLVTHDVLDAIVLADRVAILHEGRIIDEGTSEQVLGEPKNAFIAALAGVNLVHGTADAEGRLRFVDGRCFTGRTRNGRRVEFGVEISAVFPPAAVRVHRDRPGERRLENEWQSVITALEPSSGGIRIRTADPAGVVAELPPARVAELALAPGEDVWLGIAAEDILIHGRGARRKP